MMIFEYLPNPLSFFQDFVDYVKSIELFAFLEVYLVNLPFYMWIWYLFIVAIIVGLVKVCIDLF